MLLAQIFLTLRHTLFMIYMLIITESNAKTETLVPWSHQLSCHILKLLMNHWLCMLNSWCVSSNLFNIIITVYSFIGINFSFNLYILLFISTFIYLFILSLFQVFFLRFNIWNLICNYFFDYIVDVHVFIFIYITWGA